MYKIVYTNMAIKDLPKPKAAGLESKAKTLIDILKKDPFTNPPGFKKLVGDLSGLYTRRINSQHRLVYQVYKEEKTVKIISLWTHYK